MTFAVESHSISAQYRGLGASARFLGLAAGKQGEMCLQNNSGNNMQVEEASEFLLLPFLFPDLAEKKTA